MARTSYSRRQVLNFGRTALESQRREKKKTKRFFLSRTDVHQWPFPNRILSSLFLFFCIVYFLQFFSRDRCVRLFHSQKVEWLMPPRREWRRDPPGGSKKGFLMRWLTSLSLDQRSFLFSFVLYDFGCDDIPTHARAPYSSCAIKANISLVPPRSLCALFCCFARRPRGNLPISPPPSIRSVPFAWEGNLLFPPFLCFFLLWLGALAAGDDN